MNKKVETLVILLFALPSINIRGAEPYAVTRHVANNGLDSPDCGSAESPCRSITRAIQNAAEGDTILVGPGRYGDLNADGRFDDPGDEVSGSFDCRICIGKRVRVISSDGAAATVIDNGPGTRTEFGSIVVAIRAHGVQFGEKGKGFTITDEVPEDFDAALLGLSAFGPDDIRVSGNIFLDNGTLGMESVVPEGGSAYISHNTAIGNGSGFGIGGREDSRTFVVNNTAIGNRFSGFNIGGAGRHVVTDNVSSNNFRGFVVAAGGSQFHRNIVTGNAASREVEPRRVGIGFEVIALPGQGGDNHFVLNTVTGNRGVGFLFSGGSPSNVLRANNIFGNLGIVPGFQAENCGILNSSGAVQVAKDNFWGAATGPGPDPADNAGPNSGCDTSGETVVVPFATRPFRVNQPKR